MAGCKNNDNIGSQKTETLLDFEKGVISKLNLQYFANIIQAKVMKTYPISAIDSRYTIQSRVGMLFDI